MAEEPPWTTVTELFRLDSPTIEFVGEQGDRLFWHTDLANAHGRVVSCRRSNPAPCEWENVVSGDGELLLHARIVGGRLVTVWAVRGIQSLRTYDLRGRDRFDVETPIRGSSASWGAKIRLICTCNSEASRTPPRTTVTTCGRGSSPRFTRTG